MLESAVQIATIFLATQLAPLPAPAPALALPAPAPAPLPAPAPAPLPVPPQVLPIRFEFHGFVGGSVFVQDAALGPFNGGGAWYVTAVPDSDAWSLGGDVRQSRLRFSAIGASTFQGAVPRGVVELDLFGGNGSGAFGDVSVLPRLRLAYAELEWAHTKLQIGQTHSLVLALTPNTVGHIAFPLTYTAGTIGWRYPGIFAYQTFPLAGAGQSLELALMIARPAWQNPGNAPFRETFPGSADARPFVSQDGNGIGLGEASSIPQFEARVKLTTPSLESFVAGHAHRIDRSGTGSSSTTQVDLDVLAADAGVRLTLSPITLLASGYVGKNLAPLVGGLLQFQGPGAGDVHESGAWGQLGVSASGFSAWALGAFSRAREGDLRAAGLARSRNVVGSLLLRYEEAGYTLGLELTRWYTTQLTAESTTTLDGDQVMLSGLYTF